MIQVLRLVSLFVVLTVASCKKESPGGSSSAAASGPIKVAAAADLAFAFKEVGAAFTAKRGSACRTRRPPPRS